MNNKQQVFDNMVTNGNYNDNDHRVIVYYDSGLIANTMTIVGTRRGLQSEAVGNIDQFGCIFAIEIVEYHQEHGEFAVLPMIEQDLAWSDLWTTLNNASFYTQ